VVRKKDGTAKIYMPAADHVSNRTSFNFLRNVSKAQLVEDILLVGVDSTALKKGINPLDNTWNNNALIKMHVEHVPHPETMNTEKTLLALASLVASEGEVDVELIPGDLFQEIKKLQKSGELEKYLLTDGEIDFERVIIEEH